MAVGCALGTRGTGQAEGRPSRPGSGSPIQYIPPAKQQSYKFLRLFKVVFNKTEIDLPVTEGTQDGTAVLTPEVAKQHPVDQIQYPDVFCLASIVCHDKSEAMFKTEGCKTKIWLSRFS